MSDENRTARAVLDAVHEAIGPGPAVLHEPELGDVEKQHVVACIDSTFVSSVGAFVDEIEALFASYTGAARAVATVNGTSALQVALLLAGVQPGDEVIVPSLSFIATANAVTYTGAVPHFADVRPEDLGMDPEVLRHWLATETSLSGGRLVNRTTGRAIGAIVPVHVFGHPCDIREIVAIGDEFGLPVVEDAAESLGSWHGEQHTGTFGRLAAISLNGNKIITAGGGGIILTDDPELGQRAKHLTTTAKVAHRWDFVHDEVGFNFRMPNLNAALAVAQFSRLDVLLADKRALHARYSRAFDGLDAATLLREPDHTRSNYWLQAVILENARALAPTLELLNDSGFGARPVWRPLHTLPPYRAAFQQPLPVTTDLAERIINLPSSAHLGRDAQRKASA